MRTLKNRICGIAASLLALCMLLGGCSGEVQDTDQTQTEDTQMTENAILIPTVYDNPAVVTADETAAGSIGAWELEVYIPDGGGNNDMETENAVIKSPWHTLTVNGVEVPVYTARCAKSPHSFAWIDIRDGVEDFSLELTLTLSADQKNNKCVVLPESRGVEVVCENNTFTSTITETGESAAVTDPDRVPLTVMVARETPLSVPEGYSVVEIEPGYHETDALEFVFGNTVYVMKAGLHEISSIGLPSNSMLYIERGAYLQVTDRQNADGSWNTKTAIHADDAENVTIISRGLLDCGKVLGGDNKHKHVFNAGRSQNIYVEGLTIINSNTWTMCFYSCDNAAAERNLLLGYRTYSDGIMMSECTNSAGRYNFVRTGDDAIEFKGTGWWGGESRVGENCVYEYNDLWTDKGAGYCLTWESTCEMRNMVFRHNSVGFAQPTWTDRNTALDCLLGTNSNVRWGDVTFSDIEIYHVISPNVINNQLQGEGAILDNILFENITVKSTEPGVFAYRMNFDAKGGSISGIRLKNYNFCGRILTADDKGDASIIRNQANQYFDDALTIE